MSDKKLEHVNTFLKGMNTDTSDAMLSDQLYRFALNLRLITDDGNNTGELHMIEGESVYEDLNDTVAQIKAFTSIREYIIIVGTKKGDNKDYIWYIDTSGDKKLEIAYGPSDEAFGPYVTITTRYESPSNIKVYIADGIHPLMSVNIKSDHHFEKINEITGQLSIVLDQITAEKQNDKDGQTKAPVVLYAYSIYNVGGQESSLSPLSQPIIFDDIIPGKSNICDSVKLTATVLYSRTQDTLFIKIYRIAYVQNGYAPEISIICDLEFGELGTPFVFVDHGTSIGTMTMEELNAISQIPFKPLLIESKNDYLFAANINYDQQEIDDKLKGCTVDILFVADDKKSFQIRASDTKIYSGEFNKSFRTGETYRFGIVFYTKDGRKSSVMYITDRKVDPSLNPIRFVEGESPLKIKFVPIGVKTTIYMKDTEKNFDWFYSNVVGYEVVRCKRTISDTKNITQGLLGCTHTALASSTETRLASVYMTGGTYGIWSYINAVDDDNAHSSTISSHDVVMFGSPELCYQTEELKSILNNLDIELYVDRWYHINYQDTNKDVYKTKLIDRFFNCTLYFNDPENAYRDSDLSSSTILCPGNRLGLPFASIGGKYVGFNANPKENESEYEGYLCNENDIKFPVGYTEIFVSGDVTGEYNYECDIVNNNVKFVDAPDPFKFNEGDSILIPEYTTAVGSYNFVNYDAAEFYMNWSSIGQFLNSYGSYIDETVLVGTQTYACTAGKKCMVFEMSPKGGTFGIDAGTLLPITIASIRQKQVTPYNGDNESSKLNSVFYSFGAYKGIRSNDNNEMVSYTGDTFLGMFVYNSGHTWYSTKYRCTMYPTVYCVPVESSIDLRNTYGDIYPNITGSKKVFFQDEPVEDLYGYNQDDYAYMYNTAYSVTPETISYYPTKYTSIDSDNYDYRILYSNPKSNGEKIDNWLKFKPINYIDVDTRFGEITNLKLFKDTLVFWQKSATGVLSVNERTIIKDASSANIILGSSDVLQRYDYITTLYGMVPHLKADTLSNTTLYWWDGYKKDMLYYQGGNVVYPMKKAKTVSGYINKIEKFKDKPSLMYDNKYSEILFNLKNNQSLAYNEDVQQFIGEYWLNFDYCTTLLLDILFTNGVKINRWNSITSDYEYMPLLEYVVNPNSQLVKTFDNGEIGMGEGWYYTQFYNGPEQGDKPDKKQPLSIKFYTPHKQHSTLNKNITKREYDFKFAIPRDDNSVYGGRMRGRVMNCTLEAAESGTEGSRDFSLQYIITKYRISYGN